MSKRKTVKPIRNMQKDEGNQKALKIAIAAFVALAVVLGLLIVFTSN